MFCFYHFDVRETKLCFPRATVEPWGGSNTEIGCWPIATVSRLRYEEQGEEIDEWWLQRPVVGNKE